MNYVSDTNALSLLFRSCYRKRFPTLWDKFDSLVEIGDITSSREVGREIEDCPVEDLRTWAKNNKDIFPTPTAQEGKFITKIFQVRHFQQVIEKKKLFRGGKNADPFIVARA
ncbi:MAG: DUF4411 family protein [Rhodobacteraceae bacterium]|nr:DUF4411 family protein [Paracoccaceae bacterium]